MVGYANEVENNLIKAESPFRPTEILSGGAGVSRFEISRFGSHADATPIRELFDTFREIYRPEAED